MSVNTNPMAVIVAAMPEKTMTDSCQVKERFGCRNISVRSSSALYSVVTIDLPQKVIHLSVPTTDKSLNDGATLDTSFSIRNKN